LQKIYISTLLNLQNQVKVRGLPELLLNDKLRDIVWHGKSNFIKKLYLVS